LICLFLREKKKRIFFFQAGFVKAQLQHFKAAALNFAPLPSLWSGSNRHLHCKAAPLKQFSAHFHQQLKSLLIFANQDLVQKCTGMGSRRCGVSVGLLPLGQPAASQQLRLLEVYLSTTSRLWERFLEGFLF